MATFRAPKDPMPCTVRARRVAERHPKKPPRQPPRKPPSQPPRKPSWRSRIEMDIDWKKPTSYTRKKRNSVSKSVVCLLMKVPIVNFLRSHFFSIPQNPKKSINRTVKNVSNLIAKSKSAIRRSQKCNHDFAAHGAYIFVHAHGIHSSKSCLAWDTNKLDMSYHDDDDVLARNNKLNFVCVCV